ncbi:MAG: hypothetical protein QOH12_2743 [Solirubrobacteraceae bacterium]|jgi:hypothetical protein|nr:hypothetical protein [Solirubrobacteraceae bacterium]
MSVVAAAGAVAVGCGFVLTGGASGAGSLPTITIALSGATGISVSGTPVSGAVNFVSTFTGKSPQGSQGAAFGIVRLNQGATFLQAAAAVNSHQGDINALTPYGTLLVSAGAPSTIQAVLTPGSNYVALNLTGNGTPGFALFTVTQSSSPAALPAASATETAIDFGFRGPSVLHNGTIVRAENGGYVAHMITLFGVRNAATGRAVMVLLRAGKSTQAQKLATRSFVGLLGPASPGADQQQVLQTTPGYYVESCFMDTQDKREHVRLGMLRLVRVVK